MTTVVTPAGPAVGAQIHRHCQDAVQLMEIKTPVVTEYHLTLTPRRGESLAGTAGRLAATLKGLDATVVRQIGFGAVKARTAVVDLLKRELPGPELPVKWVEGEACDGGELAGIQIHAVRGAEIRIHPGPGRGVTRTWDDGLATHCVCTGLPSGPASLPPPEQAREAFQALQERLAAAGMGLGDVARTWFYLNDILAWYDGFNRVRNEVFAAGGIRPACAPASTGVGARNPAGAALAVVAWAVRPRAGEPPVVEAVASPKQCPAPKYGSAFSRAVEIRGGGFRQLLVSGTASIAPAGETAHVGDVQAQIELSMQVAEAILESRGLGLGDVSRATAYFKSAGDAPQFSRWLAARGLEQLPVVSARCDICRDDLLFEIELDAVGLD
jgi:enamine deaminase RidA (YjgF/YER057c/UK114 family)